MLPSNRVPTHPGEVLLEEFLKPMGLTQVALATHLGVPNQRVNELVRGKRGVTSETARPRLPSGRPTAAIVPPAIKTGTAVPLHHPPTN